METEYCKKHINNIILFYSIDFFTKTDNDSYVSI